MRYLSLCSGIEAASVAFAPLGWQPVAFAETDKFCSALLRVHFPHVPNHGDITRFKEWPDHAVDLVCGGTPCQSFSVAGLRQGLADPRGNLMLTFLAIVDRYRPRWVIWENVFGVLSSNGGRDFGAFLGGLGQLGYGWCYRVLDAQYVRVDGYPRAVPQRRRRVWVVGYLGDWRRAAAVLSEPEGLLGYSPPRRQAGENPAPTLGNCSDGGGRGPGRSADDADGLIAIPAPMTLAIRGRDGEADIEWRQDGTANAILTPNGGRAGIGVGAIAIQAGAVRENPASGPDGVASGHGASVAFPLDLRNAGRDPEKHDDQNRQGVGVGQAGDPAHTLTKEFIPGVAAPIMANEAKTYTNEGTTFQLRNVVPGPMAVRRLTPTECERLMGFPDGYTAIFYRKKPAADGPRYKALGNSWAVNCVRWIGTRIQMVEDME